MAACRAPPTSDPRSALWHALVHFRPAWSRACRCSLETPDQAGVRFASSPASPKPGRSRWEVARAQVNPVGGGKKLIHCRSELSSGQGLSPFHFARLPSRHRHAPRLVSGSAAWSRPGTAWRAVGAAGGGPRLRRPEPPGRQRSLFTAPGEYRRPARALIRRSTNKSSHICKSSLYLRYDLPCNFAPTLFLSRPQSPDVVREFVNVCRRHAGCVHRRRRPKRQL